MASTPTRDLPEEFLAATRKSQEAALRAIRTWVETVRTVTPRLPSVYGPLTDKLPKLPSVTVPFADKLPRSEEHTSELQSLTNLVCRLLLEKKKTTPLPHRHP